MTLKEMFEWSRLYHDNINQHMDTILRYANECQHITELGVWRGDGSTMAFLNSKCPIIKSYDIEKFPQIDGIIDMCKNENRYWSFNIGDSTKIEIEDTDLLFIDTYHVYTHMKEELRLHSSKVKKYIIAHDTNIPKPPNDRHIKEAILEFLYLNTFKIKEEFYNNNGLMILEKII